MRIDDREHLKNDWWVRQYAEGFELLDVWQYPIEADSERDFERFLVAHDMNAMVAETSVIVKGLFGLRMFLGRLFGWDGHDNRGASAGFKEVYRDHREVVNRIENATVTALMHLGWVRLPNGKWTAQMAVYAEPKGRLGRGYMKLIEPFRLTFVYPALMRAGRRRWQQVDA